MPFTDPIVRSDGLNITSVPLDMDVAYAVVEVLTAVVAAIGNSLVIVVFCKNVLLRTVTNYFLISLAIADLLVALFGIPMALITSVGLPYDFHGCLFMNSCLLLLCTSSIFSLVAVTIDRFWAIKFPLTYPSNMTRRNAQIIITTSWVVAAIIGLLPSMGWNLGRPVEPRCFFMEVVDLRYLVFLYFATILAPSFFMGFVYLLIFKAVRRQIKRMETQMLPNPTTERSNRRLRKESRAAQSIAVIILFFVISWIPLYTLNTIMCLMPSADIPSWLLHASIVLSHLNSAWNPMLYAWGMRDFRFYLYKLLRIRTNLEPTKLEIARLSIKPDTVTNGNNY